MSSICILLAVLVWAATVATHEMVKDHVAELSLSISVCLPAYLHACLPVSLSVCMSVCLSVCLSGHAYASARCVSVCQVLLLMLQLSPAHRHSPSGQERQQSNLTPCWAPMQLLYR
jgi:hypothetical protein